MDERRWGFAGLDDAEFAEFARSGPPTVPPPARPSEIVVVTLGPAGQLENVAVADDWRESVDPRRLGAEVVAAAGRAVARRLEENLRAAPPPAPSGVPDLAPWRGSLERLLADVARDVAHVSEATRVPRVATRASAAHHVTATAHHGVVTDVTVDITWARGASARGIEIEVGEVLAGVCGAADARPMHPATVALQQLAADPERLVRLAGMRP
ncbi:hypothetical protein Acsp06_31620 [Actinomycetospora sp. NBRC 106375]|uniref:hypothetical protein n=1 Tax=Actinomycetospora sp. NBRC 106375 TaxID=3032207 RepID=UPI0024A56EE1|nr:hypothetical protein [Actinomycetospora sp. NBRC 106375]GLZ46977.1 hypothetical protein Acsp06_31620 [Actinomycetospora sp. NBRC 106375]